MYINEKKIDRRCDVYERILLYHRRRCRNLQSLAGNVVRNFRRELHRALLLQLLLLQLSRLLVYNICN